MAAVLSTVADVDDNIFNRFMAPGTAPERERKRRLSDEVEERMAAGGHVLSPDGMSVTDDYFGASAKASPGAADWDGGASAAPRSAAERSRGDPTKDKWQVRLSVICFLLLGIGVAVAWTALRAGIAYFSASFPLGPSFYNSASPRSRAPGRSMDGLQKPVDCKPGLP